MTCTDPTHKRGFIRKAQGRVAPHCWTCERARDLRAMARRNAALRRVSQREIDEHVKGKETERG